MKANLNLKIYGLTKVGTKGQIIIPKDCREDFYIKSGDDFILVIVDEKVFGIGRPTLKKENYPKRCIENIGNIQIGTKYQFVIPNDIRKMLGIEPKDNLLVIGKQRAKGEEWIGFIRNDNIDFFLNFIKNYTKD